MMKKLLIILTVFIWEIGISQQYDYTLPTLNDLVKTPASPEAFAYTKYGNIPISQYTGSPNITIPIHTIKGREMELPVYLSYDASGIKVNQLATWVGLGWNLVAGGVVTRQVNGLPDDYLTFQNTKPYDVFYNSSVKDRMEKYTNFNPVHSTIYETGTVNEHQMFIRDLKDGKIETQPDSYSFSINGLSGTLFIDYENEKGYCVEHPDLKVSPIFQLNNNNQGLPTENVTSIIIGWEITDPQGTKYTFNKIEVTREYESSGYKLKDGFERDIKYNSAWYISEIKTKNEKDIFEFNYIGPIIWTKEQIAGNSDIKRDKENPSCPSYDSQPGSASHIGKREYTIEQQELSSIIVNNNLAITLTPTTGNRTDLQGKRALDKITVFNNKGQRIKMVDLVNDAYFGIVDPLNERLSRLKLEEVHFYGKTGDSNSDEKYKFEYYDSHTMPIRGSKAQDYWGYFNGKDINNDRNTLIPIKAEYDDISGFLGADRTVSIDHAKTGTLKKIIYPTGGNSQFFYKSHGSTSTQSESYEVDYTPVTAYLTGGIDNADPYGYATCDPVTPENPIGLQKQFQVDESGDFIVKLNVTGQGTLSTDGNSFIAIYKTAELCDPNIPLCNQGQARTYCDLKNDGNLPYKKIANYANPYSLNENVYLEAGNYYIMILNSNEESTIHIEVSGKKTISSSVPGVTVGGLKTYKIIDDTGDGVAKTRYFIYDDISGMGPTQIDQDFLENNGVMKGLLHMPLMMTDDYDMEYGGNYCRYKTRYSSTLAAQVSPHVTYTTVTELEYANGKVNGLKVYDFYNQSRVALNFFPAPIKPLNGKIKYEKTYKNTSTAFVLKQKTFNDYSIHTVKDVNENLIFVTGLKLDVGKEINHYTLITLVDPQDPSKGETMVEKSAEYIGFQGSGGTAESAVTIKKHEEWNFCHKTDDSGPGKTCIIGPLNEYEKRTFGFSSRWIKLDKTTSTQYDDNGNIIETTTEYEYDENHQHFQVIKEKSTNSQGKIQEAKFYYPHDSGLDFLVQKHVIATEIKREHFIDNEKIFTKESIYPTSGSITEMLYPEKINTYTYNHEEPARIELEYDDLGNIIRLTKDQGIDPNIDPGIIESFIWGYDNNYIVAKIQNLTKNQIDGIIDSTELAALNGNSLSDDDIRNLIQQLRDAYPEAIVTTYTYLPGVGVNSITDPNNLTTFYEYDTKNRLLYIEDHGGNIIQRFDYNYKQ